MKAYALDQLGQPGSVRDLPDPEPGEGQIRIRVAAAGLNPFDSAVINGYMKDHMEHRFPLVPGMDASGTVEAVGAGVEAWSAGDEVFGSVGKRYLGEGTLGELATMAAATVARKPASLSHAEAASLPVAGVSALTLADALQISQGEVVVAVGATGGVGGYVMQIAAARGARVVAVCSGENADYARSLGAAEAVDYAAGDAADRVRSLFPDGIDAVADMHGDREGIARLVELVRSGGRVASVVRAADADAAAARGIEASNVNGNVTTASLDELAGMLERGEIKSPAIRSFALDEAEEALALVGSGHVRGKLVVIP